MITYTAPTCPPGAQCPPPPAKQNYYVVRRQLRCSLPGGKGYTDPVAACRALADIVTKRSQQHPAVMCSCVLSRDAPKAVGYYNGKRRTIRLDACSLCGIHGIGADLAVLLPGAYG
jgi:hypothetical protein